MVPTVLSLWSGARQYSEPSLRFTRERISIQIYHERGEKMHVLNKHQGRK